MRHWAFLFALVSGVSTSVGAAGEDANAQASDPNVTAAPAPELVRLWPDGAPGAVGDEEADKPSLTIHRPAPAKANGAAVVVCPGGGYGFLAVDHEGKQVAEWLNSFGVTAFVLRYRIAPRYRHPAPLEDARRAIRLVRARADEWKIDPKRIGILGFSAGGHLASTAATQFEKGAEGATDPVERVSSRPDFAVLCYPVISFVESYTHRGSLRNLLGDSPAPELVESMSSERRVTAETPPTFLFHTNEDRGVPPENSIAFYLALRRHEVPAELHIYEKGRHGVGLAPGDPVLSTWPERCRAWMEARGYLKKA
ncbi:MAG TPA: alpha/beta hydrolase, partial [Planctomycetota bacterium]|nr:alpha/beta hydrolase [Planctomycetota bacterium]